MSKKVKVEEVKAKSMPGVEIPARMYLEDEPFSATVENGRVVSFQGPTSYDYRNQDAGALINGGWGNQYIGFLHQMLWAINATK